ncbi:Uncharacterised protein [Mycobacterium tuberculosis]|uniref:Uncharacterized protein n=2 Tax=Mycobacterium tuberculosis TaxID=1773 RepID=A0A0U0RGT3_MYCTX|nr:Uncharacterised protein [Mycobacterium tuberculosis]CKT58198.1 Uncharacterised protein [Mycobacterium tuberculosis]CKT66379.1 Uncharacterised protein [Mycobacterium tuberculosis]CNV27413.1 Uncharacterised protein [Mycobacterium tuberculosis]CNV48351.1 Uncharacterised protein [Mycobacterium tuberculosis]
MDSLKLYIPSTTPPSSGMDTISCTIGALPSAGVKVSVTVPGWSTLKFVARYWSPKACRPMTIGLVHPGTSRGTLEITIGSRKIVPPKMFRIVPLGDSHIFFRLNSSTRASSGVIVAHFTPTPCFLIAYAASIVTWSSVASRCSMPKS